MDNTIKLGDTYIYSLVEDLSKKWEFKDPYTIKFEDFIIEFLKRINYYCYNCFIRNNISDQGKKILYMPTHSWDGDVVEHSIGKVNFLKKLESKNVTVCLGYLDFSDPSVRRIYSQSGWKIECAGVRASKVFGSPAGGRANFLKELFRILDESDIVVADELTTGQMYAACLGKEIGLLPEEYSVTFSYSKWQSSSDFGNLNREIRALYPWLVGKKATSEKICADISQALGVDKFKDPARLMNILPWRQEEILRKVR
jgi:hypothetical protein